jgi:hypothetical protein
MADSDAELAQYAMVSPAFVPVIPSPQSQLREIHTHVIRLPPSLLFEAF